MTTKIPVQIKPFIKTSHAYRKLKVCKRCGHFTVLGEKLCGLCHRKTWITIEKRAHSLLRRTMMKEMLVLLFLLIIGLAFSQSALQTSISIVIGLLLFSLLWFVHRKLNQPALLRMLEKIFVQNADKLAAGMTHDHDLAIEVFQSGNKPLAYEMLREIGMLVRNDQLRLEQILLLQSFILRKDMDLMLEPLLMERFNPDLAAYIGELAKIKRELLKEKTFRYVLVHEAHIVQMEQGEAILVGVAGAIVRKKRYVILYQHLLLRCVRKLPRDRFLRLYNILQANPEQRWGELATEVNEIYNEKYKWNN